MLGLDLDRWRIEAGDYRDEQCQDLLLRDTTQQDNEH